MIVRKRGKSWQVDGIVDGKRIRRQFKSAAEAEEFVREGRDREPEHGLGELYSLVNASRWAWLKSSAMTDLGQQLVDYFGPGTVVAKIDSGAMNRMVADLKARGKSNATVNKWVCAMNVMLDHAVELGWIRDRPSVKPLREPSGRNRFLTESEEKEIARLVGEHDPRLSLLVEVLVDTGLRLSEAMHLQWRDVTPSQVTVHDTKNGSSRTVPLTSRAREAFASLDRGTARPFSFTDRHHASHAFTRARERSSMRGDKEVVMHTLRHTCASRMVQRGVPVAVVSAWLGHRSLAVTMRYSHLRPEQLHDYVHVLERAG
jgi:integrase